VREKSLRRTAPVRRDWRSVSASEPTRPRETFQSAVTVSVRYSVYVDEAALTV
jgi:hypothetical protein